MKKHVERKLGPTKAEERCKGTKDPGRYSQGSSFPKRLRNEAQIARGEGAAVRDYTAIISNPQEAGVAVHVPPEGLPTFSADISAADIWRQRALLFH